MCRSLVLLFFLITLSFQSFTQDPDLDKLGELDFQSLHASDISDLWGYTDENGNEYAIVGVNDTGVSIVDVSNPANPQEVYNTQGIEPSVWRDIVVHNDHAYIVNEGGGGMKIIDLDPLPGSTSLNENIYTGGSTWTTAHNLYIDSNGRAYIFGANRGDGGVIMLDLTGNPMNPVEVGTYDPNYVHDGIVRNDTLYSCHISAGEFRIVDVSDPANPQTLASHSTPDFQAHNAWLSDDGDELFVTDEVSNGHITSYDISDPSNIQELDRIQVTPGSGSIPHNLHYLNDYLVTSYYRDGVTIHDVSRPGNMVEVARYDTEPALSGDGFQGAWGAYPWLPSGNIIASDVANGLFVLDPTYERGSYLEGTVSDATNGAPINGVEVRIEPDSIVEHTSIIGAYATGIGDDGAYDVTYSEPTYFPDTLYDVPLAHDSITIRDVQLEPRPRHDLLVEVVRMSDGSPIEGARGLLDRGPDFSGNSDANGELLFQNVYQGTYELHLGKWGMMPHCETLHIASDDTVRVEMEKGYGDDFAVDLDWSVQSSSNEGHWERGVPRGTFLGPFTIDPDRDAGEDCGEKAFVTGNQSEDPGDDQVDTLSTELRSPKMDLSGWSEAHFSFRYWFVSVTGSWNVNDDDTLYVWLEEGNVRNAIDTITQSVQNWEKVYIDLSERLPFSDSIRISFEAKDPQGNTLTEAGIDRFRMQEDTTTVGIERLEENEATELISVHPNPFTDRFSLEWKGVQKVRVRIYDVHGRLLLDRTANGGSATIDASRLPSGVQILSVRNAEDGSMIERERVVRH